MLIDTSTTPTRRARRTVSDIVAASVASLRLRLTRVARMTRRVIGAPDYELYIAHVRQRHPDGVPLSRDAFSRDALGRRYNQPGSRCC